MSSRGAVRDAFRDGMAAGRDWRRRFREAQGLLYLVQEHGVLDPRLRGEVEGALARWQKEIGHGGTKPKGSTKHREEMKG